MLVDDQGLERAGIGHKNEYVIPAWIREDPQVLQVKDWLENHRQRSCAQGGQTTNDRTSAEPATSQGDEASTNQQLVQVLTSLDQRLQGVEQWATQVEVVNDLLSFERD